MTKEVEISKEVVIGGKRSFVLIAGPCGIEDVSKNDRITYRIAKELRRIAIDLGIPFVFKSSFDKANRTSVESFRGPGLEKGLEILKEIKVELGVPVISDIHLPEQAEKVADVLDIIQIPAFLCRQTDLLVAAGETGRPVNIKKGQFLAPWDIEHPIRKVENTGSKNILVTERGSSFGYNNWVVDFRSIPIMQGFGYPVVFDATHSVQLPGGRGGESGGQREYAPYLAKAAIAVGANALYVEVHEDPETALSDGPNMLKLENMKELLADVKRISEALKGG